VIPWPAISADISQSTGWEQALSVEGAVSGGDINRAFMVKFGSMSLFVKVNKAARIQMFAAEALGLQELANSKTLKVPEPVCYGSDGKTAWLVLEYLPLNGLCDATRLGRGLAAMHRVKRDRFGWERDNTIGSTPQHNDWQDDWTQFWRQQRLGFQFELAARNGHGGKLQNRGQRLLADLPALLRGHSPSASLLHGDLWSGNAGYTDQGTAVIFDPAVYFGDRETDIAMTELFGGFGAGFHSAYREAYPLNSGYSVRKNLYNLYHVLNHLNLFGGGYATRALSMTERLLAEIG
jgi:fructosamine-3-kinase